MASNLENIYEMTDAEILSALLDNDTTPEELEARGFGYWLTELTPEEAERLGAKAYLMRRLK